MSARRRLFAQRLPSEGGVVVLDASAAHHARVLRLSVGDPVTLFDGEGAEADARLTGLEERRGRCESRAARRVAEDPPRVVLMQGIPKGAKLDGIVRMATELGVAAVHLVLCERSVARPGATRLVARLERLERIAREAARQSGRCTVPSIVPPAPLPALLDRPPPGASRVALWERALEPLPHLDPRADVWVLVGPEGGLTDGEAEALRGCGYALAGLGAQILRVETASPIAIALVSDRLGGLRPRSRPLRP